MPSYTVLAWFLPGVFLVGSSIQVFGRKHVDLRPIVRHSSALLVWRKGPHLDGRMLYVDPFNRKGSAVRSPLWQLRRAKMNQRGVHGLRLWHACTSTCKGGANIEP